MKEEETATYIITASSGLAEYQARHHVSPRSLPEVVGNTKCQLGLLDELGWHD